MTNIRMILVLKWYTWHNTIKHKLILRIYFATLVMFYVVNFSHFDVKSIIFTQFWPGPLKPLNTNINKDKLDIKNILLYMYNVIQTTMYILLVYICLTYCKPLIIRSTKLWQFLKTDILV